MSTTKAFAEIVTEYKALMNKSMVKTYYTVCFSSVTDNLKKAWLSKLENPQAGNT